MNKVIGIGIAALVMGVGVPQVVSATEKDSYIDDEVKYCIWMNGYYQDNPDAAVFDGWPDYCKANYPTPPPSSTTTTTGPAVLIPPATLVRDDPAPATAVTIAVHTAPAFTG